MAAVRFRGNRNRCELRAGLGRNDIELGVIAVFRNNRISFGSGRLRYGILDLFAAKFGRKRNRLRFAGDEFERQGVELSLNVGGKTLGADVDFRLMILQRVFRVVRREGYRRYAGSVFVGDEPQRALRRVLLRNDIAI